MTRLCKWCDTPLPKDAHGGRKYCVGGCYGEASREYRQRPEVKERRRVLSAHPEAKRKRREYDQRPEAKRKRREYRQRPEVRERKQEYRKRQADQALLATLLSMGVSDETMNEFGFERVEEDATE